LTYSERPLSIGEAIDAIAVETEKDQYFDVDDRLPDPSEISCYCSSLVVVVHTSKHSYHKYNKLQLAHFSVREYLTSTRLDEDIAQAFEEVAAKASIAKICLAYLLHFDWDVTPEEVRESFPLADYSARYWMTHAAAAEDKDERLQGFIKEFFCYHEKPYKTCYSLYHPDEPQKLHSSLIYKDPASPLYYASFGGLGNAVKCLLTQGVNINAQGGYYHNALHAASTVGHEKVVELLLAKGVDINAKSSSGETALSRAVEYGKTEVVKLLLEKDADIEAKDTRYGQTPLLLAASYGHIALVELLLEKGADIEAKDTRHSRTPLSWAAENGHRAVVELLLEKGADIEAKDCDDKTPLLHASEKGYTDIVGLLLTKGADTTVAGADKEMLY
jgi:ankyrin repeat protein